MQDGLDIKNAVQENHIKERKNTSVGLRFGRDERGDRPHDGTGRLGINLRDIVN